MTGHWIGLKEANRALKQLPEFARVHVQQMMDVTAHQVAEGARRRAPVRTGALARAIGWSSRPRSLSAVAGVDPSAFYWKFLEYGTVRMGARPMFRPAAVAMEADHQARLEQVLAMALTKIRQEAAV